MNRHEVQTRFDDQSPNRLADERDSAVVGLLAAAISGFLVGLVTRGEFACAAAVAVLVPATGIAAWRLRAAFARGSFEAGDGAPDSPTAEIARTNPVARGERHTE